MRIASSILDTKILPSPIRPVAAVLKIARMTPSLARSEFAHALQEGLAALEGVLEAKPVARQDDAGNELSDRPIDLRGSG